MQSMVNNENPADLLRDSTYDLIYTGIESAKRGNNAVLITLLNKIIPNVNLNVDANSFDVDKEIELVKQKARQLSRLADNGIQEAVIVNDTDN